MNKEHVLAAIAVMKRAQRLDMTDFQEVLVDNPISSTIDELHACGNSACFSGYMAISGLPRTGQDPDTLSMTYGGTWDPFFAGAADHMAAYLGVSVEVAGGLLFGNIEDFYPVELGQIEPQHVIDKLVAILCGELE